LAEAVSSLVAMIDPLNHFWNNAVHAHVTFSHAHTFVVVLVP
jgi:hypothetical protein